MWYLFQALGPFALLTLSGACNMTSMAIRRGISRLLQQPHPLSSFGRTDHGSYASAEHALVARTSAAYAHLPGNCPIHGATLDTRAIDNCSGFGAASHVKLLPLLQSCAYASGTKPSGERTGDAEGVETQSRTEVRTRAGVLR